MIKLFWYTYFVIYLFLNTMASKIKLVFLRKNSDKILDEYIYNKARKISKHVLNKSHTTTLIEGINNIPKEPCVFVSNHQAIFDAFLLIANIDKPIGFIAKKEIKTYPLIGWWITQIHTVYIDRKNIREGMKAINEGVERLKKGYSMIIFPEGTRSLKSEMGEFKKGSMKLAVKANAPIVPLTIDGTYNVLEVGNKVRGNAIKLIIHKPIYLENVSKEDKKNLTQILHDIIESGLKQK